MATLVLDRALRILEQLSRYDARGLSLSDLARQSGIPHPTVHRLLRDMAAARLVTPLPDGRGYVLGRLPFEHGLAARARHDVTPLFAANLRRLSEATGYAAYLFVLSGVEAVCYDHTQSQRLDPPLSVTVGGRRPLGVGAAGLALMAAQDDARIEAALRANGEALGRYGGLDVPTLRGLLAQTRKLGYARNGGCLNTNTAAIGHAVADAGGRAFAAISLSTTVARLTQREALRLAALLRAEIAEIRPRVHFHWDDAAALR
ncbi:helix-turn-helix domain-containing protein [Roseateles sp. DAIF2]|uniref:IclR family transcriptional regulator n=1 Tax=Roseateles sp. DAIF2 TaxID=2714952 RepID=UPI0018A28963|nr:IclR family transcriptional regulator C-terminal domain-containing protein [Roseateles sp. DAIF2]QPF76152.1 helix-turn-helix domain-containing protein [Roseateles sp. DAIF2]